MRRVVVTGMGIVSSIGNNTQEVTASLHDGKSGVTRADRQAELGFRSQVHGAPTLRAEDVVDRRAMRFHGGGTAWNHVAMDQAIVDSGLAPDEVSHERTGIVMGSGGPSTRAIVEAADMARAKGPKRVGPFAVPKSMSSTASATLSTWFKIQGVQLFDFVGLRDIQSLHRRSLRAYSCRPAGCDVRRRVRRTRLDIVGPVRRDGSHVLRL